MSDNNNNDGDENKKDIKTLLTKLKKSVNEIKEIDRDKEIFNRKHDDFNFNTRFLLNNINDFKRKKTEKEPTINDLSLTNIIEVFDYTHYILYGRGYEKSSDYVDVDLFIKMLKIKTYNDE